MLDLKDLDGEEAMASRMVLFWRGGETIESYVCYHVGLLLFWFGWMDLGVVMRSGISVFKIAVIYNLYGPTQCHLGLGTVTLYTLRCIWYIQTILSRDTYNERIDHSLDGAQTNFYRN